MAHPGGRPPKYTTVEELESKIEEYFDSCVPVYAKNDDGSLVLTTKGEPVLLDHNPPTITGLALHLGFTTRLSLINYQSKPQFMNTVSRAKARVELYAEKQLYNPAIKPNGPIFALKNFGWRDSQELQHTHNNTPTLNLKLMTDGSSTPTKTD